MQVTIRSISAEELPRMGHVLTGAFGDPVPPDQLDRFGKNLDLARTFCCFDGDEMVGTSGSFGFTMTVPGGEAPLAGVTMVSVRPSHTRRGLMSRMMRSLLDDAHERGEPLAALWASEESIYQRYGFGLASNQGHIDVERARVRFLDDPGPIGRVRMIDLDEAAKTLPSIYDRLRPRVPGMLARDENWWRFHRLNDIPRMRGGGSPLACAVLEIDRSDEAYVLFRTHPRWTDGGTSNMWLKVEELVALSPLATREMWRFAFGVDLVERVKGWWLPSDLPLTLMVAEPRRLAFAASESFWLRIVDVEAALNARSFRAGEPVVLEVSDAYCAWNAGRYVVSPDGATRTEDEPDIRLDVSALAAVYLGEFTFARLERSLRAEELTPGALDRGDQLFATERAPWSPENF